MAELKATVCLQGKDIEVISSHIEFNRKTDNKGRPVTNVIGGRITITVESTRETTILEAMVNSPFKAISGKVIYYNTKDNSIFRVVEFKYAYIVYYKEIYNVDRKDKDENCQIQLSITADTLEFINTGKREEATSEAGSQTDTTSDVPVPSVAMPQENKEDLPF